MLLGLITSSAVAQTEVVYFSPYVTIVKPNLESNIAIDVEQKLLNLNYNESQGLFERAHVNLKVVAPQGNSYLFYQFRFSSLEGVCQFRDFVREVEVNVLLDGEPMQIGTPSRVQFEFSSAEAKWKQHRVDLIFPPIRRKAYDVFCHGTVGFTAELSL